jgi:GDP-mannose 6-dehydrogenase
VKVSIFGLGYVGCVSAGCMAADGHTVIGVDVNPQKVEQIESGQSPVIEPGLDEFIEQSVKAGNLSATMDARQAVMNTDISLICVGTPSAENGSLDTTYVEKVAMEIGRILADKDTYHVVVVRSTVLPSTVRSQVIPILEQQSGKQVCFDFGVSMNPEFLREGSAVKDYYHPSYVVIGESDERSGALVESLYATVEAPLFRTTIETAEMVKYVSNAFHALKIAFANEIGNLSKAHNVDGQEVMAIFVQDKRLNISPSYLRPGFAFGGSCLPKDLRAMLYRAKEYDVDVPVLNAVMASNEKQIQLGIQLVEHTGLKKIGVLGLGFKSGTDDVRESPAVPLIETLMGRGYQVSVYDDIVRPEMLIGANRAFLERELPHIASIMRSSIDEVVTESEVVVITNGSKSYQPALDMMNSDQVLIDLVGIAKNGHQNVGAYVGISW